MIDDQRDGMLTVSLSEGVKRRLEALARATGRSQALHVEQAIIEYLDDFEDFDLAEREAEEVRAGRSKTVALAVLMAQYGVVS